MPHTYMCEILIRLCMTMAYLYSYEWLKNCFNHSWNRRNSVMNWKDFHSASIRIKGGDQNERERTRDLRCESSRRWTIKIWAESRDKEPTAQISAEKWRFKLQSNWRFPLRPRVCQCVGTESEGKYKTFVSCVFRWTMVMKDGRKVLTSCTKSFPLGANKTKGA